MVLAKKKAAGAENYYNYQYNLPQGQKHRVVRRKVEPSPIYKTVIGVFFISCFFIIALGFTYMKASIACLNRELSQIKQENAAIAESIEKTKLEIAGLKSLNRIKNIAVTELGMTENPQITYLVMNDVFAEEKEEQKNTADNEQGTPQVAAGEVKNSIFKAVYEALALRDFLGKG